MYFIILFQILTVIVGLSTQAFRSPIQFFQSKVFVEDVKLSIMFFMLFHSVLSTTKKRRYKEKIRKFSCECQQNKSIVWHISG